MDRFIILFCFFFMAVKDGGRDGGLGEDKECIL